MQCYSVTTPLVAVRLFRSHEKARAGVMSSLPANAIVEMQGPSELGDGLVEVSWEHQRFAVFEQDLKIRGNLVRTAAAGD